jgi:hypothetical protein
LRAFGKANADYEFSAGGDLKNWPTLWTNTIPESMIFTRQIPAALGDGTVFIRAREN